MSIDLKMWDRQPTETDKSWSAFVIYRDLPVGERTLAKVGLQLGKSETLMERWSARFRWVDRVAAYDGFIDRSIAQENRLERERLKNQMVERHTKTGVFVQNNAVEAFQKMTDADWDKLSPVNLTRIFLQMASFERLSRGLPTNFFEVKTPEQIRQQQITEARIYFDEIRHDFPLLSERECLQIVCESFEVSPFDLGFDDDALDGGEDLDDEN